MEKLVDEGLVRAIGLSNVNKEQLLRIYEKARVKPANLQVIPQPPMINSIVRIITSLYT